jgi:flavin reductase (DIM6/NTAB) family NADH-FMN oxidoreductase RutF
MFYKPETDQDHGLPHNPFNAIVTPRPIGWVSTADAHGVPNLAPFSFFNGAAYNPPIVTVAFTGQKLGKQEGDRKDTLANIRATGEFAVNIVPTALMDQMNITAGHLSRLGDEFEEAGLTALPCNEIAAPRVGESPATLECKLLQAVELPNTGPGCNVTVFGQVVGVHIDDNILKNGLIDPSVYKPLARMGYLDYATIDSVFELKRPK